MVPAPQLPHICLHWPFSPPLHGFTARAGEERSIHQPGLQPQLDLDAAFWLAQNFFWILTFRPEKFILFSRERGGEEEGNTVEQKPREERGGKPGSAGYPSRRGSNPCAVSSLEGQPAMGHGAF